MIQKFLKGLCMFFYLLLAILTMISYNAYWRNLTEDKSNALLNKEIEVLENRIKLLPNGAYDQRHNLEGDILKLKNHKSLPYAKLIAQYTINGECNTPFDEQDCFVSRTRWFCGDAGVAFFLAAASTIYIGNFVYLIIASIAKIHEKALHILPISSLLATLSLVIAILIFAIKWNSLWQYVVDYGYDHEIVLKNEYVLVALAMYFGAGFWLTLISILFSFIAVALSACVSFLAHKVPQNVGGGRFSKFGGMGGADPGVVVATPVTVQAAPTQADAPQTQTAPAEAPPTAAPQVNNNVPATT